MYLEMKMSSEISQIHEIKYCVVSLLREIQSINNSRREYKTDNRKEREIDHLQMGRGLRDERQG